MTKTKSFMIDNYNINEPIIIYGASVYGEIAYHALRELGIKPDYFCDQAREKSTYFDIPVIRLQDLITMKEANIIIASADYFNEIKDELEGIGFSQLFDMTELVRIDIPDQVLSNRAKEMYSNREHYIDVVHNSTNHNALVINRIQYVVSERCSLKCKDCTHLMQYYQKPMDIDLDRFKQAFERLLDADLMILELRILGGEPFMNQEMYKVIDWYHDNDKIQSISVYTNGTIIPSERILQSLQKEKVKVHISNYGLNQERVSKLVNVLKEHKIKFFERIYDNWQDAGDLKFRDYSKEHMETIFSQCFERNCITFFKGVLHRCPRSAHAMNLGAMPIIKEDFVDLLNSDTHNSELLKDIEKLLKKKYIEACNYCNGLNNHMQNIPPAIQTNTPLMYKKIDDTE